MKKVIAIDFDGTLVRHLFPEIGEQIHIAFAMCMKWKREGHKLILWTCRNNEDPQFKSYNILTEAVDFCNKNGLFFDAINENVSGAYPSPKVYADIYIDDRANNGVIDWLEMDRIVNE